MKYADIITVQDAEYFLPVFDLANEHANYWKQFVPTPQFYDLLENALEAVGSSQPGRRKSLWVQGTFGTGKSHASSVIRHLLCDDWADVAEYVNTRVKKPDARAKLESLRKEKRLFPVVLKGVQGIHNTRTFELTLERTVKDALRGIPGGKQIAVNSDFEKAVSTIETNPLVKLDEILPHQPALKAIAKNKTEIIRKLKACDVELYLALEEALANYNIYLKTGNLTQWLSEVEKEIQKKKIADGLILFWDEFTSVMDTITSGLTNQIQNIAELAEKQDLYLFLISHRHSTAYGDRGEDIRKMNDRFHIIQYRMEANTTYHLMAATLKIKDDAAYRQLAGGRTSQFSKLISYLTDGESAQAQKDITNLFPLHPYTASLCSAISDHIGSANRSVFEFMYADKGGFLDYINTTDADARGNLLTAEWLWNFFRQSFENDANKYSVVTETHNAHIKTVQNKGVNYEKVFKGILLLNALRCTYDNEKVQPSEENIRRLFEGEPWAAETDEILTFFNHNQIIQKDPLDNYIIEFSSLPIKEVNAEKKQQESIFTHAGRPDATKIISLEQGSKDAVARLFGAEGLIRKSEIIWLSCAYDEFAINNRLKGGTGFRSDSSLHIALFLAVTEQEQFGAVEMMRRLAVANPDVLFVSFASAMDNDGMQWDRFISYVATQQVAQRHALHEQAEANKKKAAQSLENWVNRLKSGNVTLYFRDTEHESTYVSLARYINEQIIHQIFTAGAEAVEDLRTAPMTFWRELISKKAAEVMLSKPNRDLAEGEFRGPWAPAKQLFRDNSGDHIVDERMQLKPDADPSHPLTQIQKRVDELIAKAREQRPGGFNLGSILLPLASAPFGLYGNYPNMAMLGFALRKYLGEFNNADVGTTVNAEDLRNKVEDIFKFWRREGAASPDRSLEVRFGTKAERDLKDLLVRLFNLSRIPGVPELTSIKNVRWGINEYCSKLVRRPLWSLRHTGANETLLDGIYCIVELLATEEPTQEKISATLDTLRSNEYDILELVQKKDAYEKGFLNFIKRVEDVQLKEEWMPELLNDFLPGALQGEISSWKEQDVKDKVKSFYIKKITPAPAAPQGTPALNNSVPPPPALPPPPPETLAKVKTKIKSASNIDKLRATLEQVLEKFPGTATLIESTLE